jgi:hypothetical protein
VQNRTKNELKKIVSDAHSSPSLFLVGGGWPLYFILDSETGKNTMEARTCGIDSTALAPSLSSLEREEFYYTARCLDGR